MLKMYGTRARKFAKFAYEFTGSIRRNKLKLGVFMEKVEAWHLRNGLGFF